ncbi:MAG TPA: SAM-dependent methyltransferase [Bacillota bacterium]|nr:SAM-dependent methyltransferase [Bacillota bacterium]
MVERTFDEALNIHTIGVREWKGKEEEQYNRYEATPYEALEMFFNQYELKQTDTLVDFGAGEGRVSFYVHNRFNIPVKGIENNDKTFEEALRNQKSYQYRGIEKDAPIYFEFGLAELYEVQPTDNRFFLFNPFSVSIFKQVIANITISLKEHPRMAEVILYYPLPAFKRVMKHTPFQKIKKIKVPKIHGKYGKFIIYRFTPESL